MDAETVARATEPFFTTKPVGKGTGLGLAMAHGLMSQSGGTLHLDSVPGRGTRIDLWLPVAEDVPGLPAAPPPMPAHTGGRPLRVLLVDDDPVVLAGTAAMLEDLGHHVTEAGSALEALGCLREGATVDLVVTDQVMPGMTGAELAEELRRLHPSLPVLLASGYAELSEEDAMRLLRLRKPFSQAELASAVADATSSGGTWWRCPAATPMRRGLDAPARFAFHLPRGRDASPRTTGRERFGSAGALPPSVNSLQLQIEGSSIGLESRRRFQLIRHCFGGPTQTDDSSVCVSRPPASRRCTESSQMEGVPSGCVGALEQIPIRWNHLIG